MNNTLSFYDFANDFSQFTNRCIFITGKAGTGKTTFLRQLREKTNKQMAVVAPTGVAALNAGGTTIHSFFHLPFTPFIPTAESRKNLLAEMRMQANQRRVLYELELLVIDEVSMVRADVLDEIDTVLRHFKYRFNEPFGGVQVIFIGDLFQLSPVVKEEERAILSPYYAGCYFFHSKVMEQLQPVYIELDKVFRQPNAEFVALLNQVRNNCLTAEGFAQLNRLYQPNYQHSAKDFHITLTTHNEKADRINESELAKLKTQTHYFSAIIEGDFKEQNYPTDKMLALKVGARVMFIKNDEGKYRRFYNGKIGIVKRFEEDEIVVQCTEDSDLIYVSQMAWKNIRYTTDPDTKHISEEELGSFTQYPLRLAWAITVHKSQGLTFDKAIIDVGQAFTAGQVYVALSRCRTLDGIVLLSQINSRSLNNSQDVLHYSENRTSLSELETMLPTAKAEFRLQILSELFDFRKQLGQIERLVRLLKTTTSFSKNSLVFLEKLHKKLFDIQTVGVKFQDELSTKLFVNPINESNLISRMQKAETYFSLHIDEFLHEMQHLSAQTDVKKDARDFDDTYQTLYADIAQKKWLMNKMAGQPTISYYFEVKNTFTVPVLGLTSYAADAAVSYTTSDNPELLQALLEWRNGEFRNSDKTSLRAVLSTQILQTIANELPHNITQLRRIKGLGKVKVDAYGSQILKIVNNFRKMNQMEVASEKEFTKEIKPKIKSDQQSLEMYKRGLTIEQIAAERNLACSTIIGHLLRFIRTNEVKFSDFLSEKK